MHTSFYKYPCFNTVKKGFLFVHLVIIYLSKSAHDFFRREPPRSRAPPLAVELIKFNDRRAFY